MNNGYLYVNYSRTNNCYSYVKLISKYQNIITAHPWSIHVRIEFIRRNTFNVLIATALVFCNTKSWKTHGKPI